MNSAKSEILILSSLQSYTLHNITSVEKIPAFVVIDSAVPLNKHHHSTLHFWSVIVERSE